MYTSSTQKTICLSSKITLDNSLSHPFCHKFQNARSAKSFYQMFSNKNYINNCPANLLMIAVNKFNFDYF